MKDLTEEKAIDLTIELWVWLAETGREKEEWPGWEKYGGLNRLGNCLEVEALCFLCEYASLQPSLPCSPCPYFKKFSICYSIGAPFSGWEGAETSKTRMEYAQKFLDQMNQIKEALGKESIRKA